MLARLAERSWHVAACAILLLVGTPSAWAKMAGLHGSGGFCLFALPGDRSAEGDTRLVNLGIAQYVELRADELCIVYGGGNLGSGHEARIPVTSREQGMDWLDMMKQAAATCRAESRP